MLEQLKKLRQYLLTGVSFAIPFIACGGILIAASIGIGVFMGAPMTSKGPDLSAFPKLMLMSKIGETSFRLMLPILAGYIAYAIAGKPGLVSGFLGGYFSDEVKAGFLGALVAGLLAGFVVEMIKKVPVPKHIKPIMPILIIPIISSLIIGVIMLKVLGAPIAGVLDGVGRWLEVMGTGNAVLLGLILGAMIAFDMGGPINKAAFFFGSAMIAKGNYAVMGACAAAICTPPLGLGLATMIRKKLWTEEEREAGGAALAMGMIGITEGAIPFAASDPLRVIPCIMLGSMVSSVTAMLGKVGDHAPHGGPIVLPVVDNRIMYVIAILAGVIVTAVSINLVKALTTKPVCETETVEA
jgi:fructose PTS system EIIBC or EIIC component